MINDTSDKLLSDSQEFELGEYTNPSTSDQIDQSSHALKVVVGVPKETCENENRVAMSPTNADKLIKQGVKVLIERGAGIRSTFRDEDQENVGAEMVKLQEIYERSNVILKVRPICEDDVINLNNGAVQISMLNPVANQSLLKLLADQAITSFALEKIPRNTLNQQQDVLSSMANIAGYKSIIEAAGRYKGQLVGQMTAAGKTRPANVFIAGGGVAGLSALQTAVKLGAIVKVNDIRSAVKEQVESLGGEFVTHNAKLEGEARGGQAKELGEDDKNQQKLMQAKYARESDILILTAMIPNRPAPLLITSEMVQTMNQGSVIVDLAAETGGNCELTEKNIVVEKYGVTIIGYTDFPSQLANTSSTLFSNNVQNFFNTMLGTNKHEHLSKLNSCHGELDDLFHFSCVTHQNQVIDCYKELPFLAPVVKKENPNEKKENIIEMDNKYLKPTMYKMLSLIMVTTSLIFLAYAYPKNKVFLMQIVVFFLALIVGYQAVWGVRPALHTPLMSITNAISGLTSAGALYIIGDQWYPYNVGQIFGCFALLVSSVNIAGGFLITKRMLDKFKRPTDPKEYNQLFLFALLFSTAAFQVVQEYQNIKNVKQIVDLISAMCCIIGVACLSKQSTARLGLYIGVVGVFLGVSATMAEINPSINILPYTLGLIFIGMSIGIYLGYKVSAMLLPPTIAIFHSLVGIAAVLTSIGSFQTRMLHAKQDNMQVMHLLFSYLGTLIGAVTFTGSIVAQLKLSSKLKHGKGNLPCSKYINIPSFTLVMTGFVLIFISNNKTALILVGAVGILGLLLGQNITNTIGSADMPVAITVLNSYSGWALVAEGFLLQSFMLTIVGALIGSSGGILTYIMCKAMNRSIFNVIFGSYATLKGTMKKIEGEHKEINVEDTADLIVNSKSIICVPGYGLAVGQAQAGIRDVFKACIKNDIKFRFAIHPVAGRMPGQLNVILAEVAIPYDSVQELTEINKDFENTDISLVVGANDIVNCSALEDPNSPIQGMPVLHVWKAKNSIVNKRTMGVGYADIDNPLFFKDNNQMLLGNSKDKMAQLSNNLREKFNE